MGDLSPNFSRHEFACGCGCGLDTISPQLVNALEEMRRILWRPITIVSGMRCALHNARIGGAKNSAHLRGIAADIFAERSNPRDMYAAAVQVPSLLYGGIGVGAGIFHVDVRGEMARWGYDESGKQAAFKDPRK